MTQAPPRTNSRRRLSLEIILANAIQLIERDVARALTMRSLGRELSVDESSLYCHVDSFDALLGAVVNQVVDAILNKPQMQPQNGNDWRAFLTQQAHGIRRIAVV